MELEIKKPQTVNAKTLKVMAKCTNTCSVELISDKGESIHESDNGVPSFFPGSHYGDYLELDIDIDTGTITNWVKPAVGQVQNWIEAEE
jgi:hypothetical protein